MLCQQKSVYSRLWFFQWSCMDVRVGLWRKLSAKKVDTFELWCWRRLLRVPWTARRSNQSILKEISPGCSLERLTLKLKLQYFDHVMRRVDSLEKNPDAGRDWGQEKGVRRRGGDGWMGSLTQWAWVWVNSRSWWWTGRPGVLQFMGLQTVGHDWVTELNWTELMGPDAIILVYWMLSFKPTFSLSSFTFIKRLFSSSLLSAIRVVSSAYLRLLITFSFQDNN